MRDAKMRSRDSRMLVAILGCDLGCDARCYDAKRDARMRITMLHRTLESHPTIALRNLEARLRRSATSSKRDFAEARLRVRNESWTLRMRTEDNLPQDIAFQQTEISHEDVALLRSRA